MQYIFTYGKIDSGNDAKQIKESNMTNNEMRVINNFDWEVENNGQVIVVCENEVPSSLRNLENSEVCMTNDGDFIVYTGVWVV